MCVSLTFKNMEPKTGAEDPNVELTGGFLQRGGNNGQGIQIRARADELSKPSNPEPRKPGAGKGRKTKLAAFGLSPSIIKEGDPEYSACLYQANKYRKTRMRELAELHGHVSAGAGALLASASLALAASRYLYQRAAKDGCTDDLKTASKLADSARQSELAAWELSSREGVLKRRQEASEAGMPWIVKNDGELKAKPGRKTNAERQQRDMEAATFVVESEVED